MVFELPDSAFNLMCCIIASKKRIDYGVEDEYDEDEDEGTVNKMVDKLEDFDDVQTVYTNMKPEEGDA